MKANIGFGVLCGALVTIALTAVLYLANQLAGTPFVPYDLFDWMARVLPGAIVTFGIDLMIDVLRVLDVSVAGTAKTAERVMAVGQFLLLGTTAGVLFFRHRKAARRIAGRRHRNRRGGAHWSSDDRDQHCHWGAPRYSRCW